MEVFAEAAGAESFVLAAQRLGMDQATVGRRIAKLEARIGQKLFHRSAAGVQLTDFGRQMLEVSTGLIQSSRKFESALQALSGTRALRIKAPESIAHYMLTPIISGANFGPFQMTQLLEISSLLFKAILVSDNDGLEPDVRFEWSNVGSIPPAEPSAKVRRLMTVNFLPFYTDAYVAAHGQPGGFDDLKCARLGWLNGWEGMGEPACFEPWYQLMRASPVPPIRVLSSTTLERMVTHGQFISLFPMQMPLHAPSFRPILDGPPMQLDLWLVVADHVFKIPHLLEPYQDLIKVFQIATNGIDAGTPDLESDGLPALADALN